MDILFDLKQPMDDQIICHDILNKNVTNLTHFQPQKTKQGLTLFICFFNGDTNISVSINLEKDFFGKAIFSDKTQLVLAAQFNHISLIRFYQNMMFFHINHDYLKNKHDCGYVDCSNMKFNFSYFWLKDYLRNKR